MPVPLFPIHHYQRAIIHRRTSNIISNVRGGTSILRRQSTITSQNDYIRRLLSMRIHDPNIRLPLNSNSRHFATTILKRARRYPNITFHRTIIRRRLPLILNRLRWSRLINRYQLDRTGPLNHLHLHAIPRSRRVPRTLHLLRKIRVLPLGVFRGPRHHHLIINVITGSNQSNLRLYRLTNTRTPLPHRRLVTIFFFTRHCQLRRTILPSTNHGPHGLLLVRVHPHLG